MEIEITKDIFLPDEYRENFHVDQMEELSNEYRVTVLEKEEKIPKELSGKEAVLDGYCNVLEIIDYPFHGKLMYLRIYRRKWKEKGKQESFSNTYNLHPNGCKLTTGFGNFLKGLTGRERTNFLNSVKGLKDIWEENRTLV